MIVVQIVEYQLHEMVVEESIPAPARSPAPLISFSDMLRPQRLPLRANDRQVAVPVEEQLVVAVPSVVG